MNEHNLPLSADDDYSTSAEDVLNHPMHVPYGVFVDNLFVKPVEHTGRLAHAAVGIIGEVVELRQAHDREEALEELGDLWFYMKAARITLGAFTTDHRHLPQPAVTPITQEEASRYLLSLSAIFLDLAKKAWIYDKSVIDLLPQMQAVLADLYHCHRVYCNHLGFTLIDVERANRLKLLKRYDGGKYSDAAAQARKDKVGG